MRSVLISLCILSAPALQGPSHAQSLPSTRLVCPGDALIHGQAPPAGDRQFCAIVGADGQLVPHGPFVQYFRGGGPELLGEYTRGERSGRWVELDPRGEVLVDSHYQRGVLHGAYRGRSDDGLRLEGSYKAGKRDGAWRTFLADGSLQSEGAFKADKREGRWTSILDDGTIARGDYRKDLREGPWEFGSPNGRLLAKGSFRKDLRHGDWQDFDEAGILRARGRYASGQPAGIWEHFDARGQPLMKGETRRVGDQEQRIGPWVEWNPDGSRQEGRYVDGLRAGPWRTFYPSGQLSGRGPMRDGLMDGDWEHLDPSGAPQAEGPYVRGRRHGVWTERGDDGLRYEGPYVDGVRHGPWQAFDADGATAGVLEFVHGVSTR